MNAQTNDVPIPPDALIVDPDDAPPVEPSALDLARQRHAAAAARRFDADAKYNADPTDENFDALEREERALRRAFHHLNVAQAKEDKRVADAAEEARLAELAKISAEVDDVNAVHAEVKRRLESHRERAKALVADEIEVRRFAGEHRQRCAVLTERARKLGSVPSLPAPSDVDLIFSEVQRELIELRIIAGLE